MRALVCLAFVILGAGVATAGTAPQGHPHFNDGGTLSWYSKLADAKVAAKKADKLIFVEFGRKA
jgi:hypothetical protein